jgi:hypothetical protein
MRARAAAGRGMLTYQTFGTALLEPNESRRLTSALAIQGVNMSAAYFESGARQAGLRVILTDAIDSEWQEGGWRTETRGCRRRCCGWPGCGGRGTRWSSGTGSRATRRCWRARCGGLPAAGQALPDAAPAAEGVLRSRESGVGVGTTVERYWLLEEWCVGVVAGVPARLGSAWTAWVRAIVFVGESLAGCRRFDGPRRWLCHDADVFRSAPHEQARDTDGDDGEDRAPQPAPRTSVGQWAPT